MKKWASILLVFLIGMLFSTEASAQINRRRKKVRKQARRMSNFGRSGNPANYWSLGFELNTMNYFGDIAPSSRKFLSTRLSDTNPGLGIFATKRMNSFFSLRGELLWGRIEGKDADANDDSGREIRNLNFRNDIIEFNGTGILDFFETNSSSSRPFIVPYLFLGISVYTHSPKGLVPVPDEYFREENAAVNEIVDQYQGQWVSLRELETEKDKPLYSSLAIALPIGFGARIKLNRQWDFSAEIGYRQTFTNYLDDIGGGEFPEDPNSFNSANENSILGYIMSYPSNDLRALTDRRGGEGNYDTYLITSFKLSYVF